MDPVSLTLGIVPLYSMVTSCLDAIDHLETYRNYDTESHQSISLFNAEKSRFIAWVNSVGVDEQKLNKLHHLDEDESQRVKVTMDILKSIRALMESMEAALPPRPKSTSAFRNISVLSTGKGSLSDLNAASRGFEKAKWAFRGKKKFDAQVQTFQNLVGKLYELFPPKNNTDVVPVEPGLEMGAPHRFPGQTQLATEVHPIFEEFSRMFKAQKKTLVKDWIAAPPVDNIYSDSVSTRVSGTCDWILRHPVFVEWMSFEPPQMEAKFLWVHGSAGFGKTFLCARVVQFLLENFNYPTAYFFFSSSLENRKDPFSVLRSWISQILEFDDRLLEVAAKQAEASRENSASKTQLLDLFNSLVHRLPGCIFILDGLDECETAVEDFRREEEDVRKNFLSSLKASVLESSTRILIFSRNEVDIRTELDPELVEKSSQCFLKCEISSGDVKNDVLAFSRDVVEKKIPNKGAEVRDHLATEMTERAEGMFLWVKLQQRNLNRGHNKKKLYEAITQAPAHLSRIYERNWTQISSLEDQDKSRAISILRLVVFSTRPLTVLEITYALLVLDDDDYEDIPLDELPDDIDNDYIEDRIIALCASLVETRGSESKNALKEATVHLVHFTVKEYLLKEIFKDEATEKNVLASVCLKYLNFPGVWKKVMPFTGGNNRHFLEYAANSWQDHAEPRGQGYEGVVSLQNGLLNKNSAVWESWREWFDLKERADEPSNAQISAVPADPLYYASRLGMLNIVQHLFQESELQPNNIAAKYGTALQAACCFGHLDVVKCLIDHGADIDLQAGKFETPINGAAANGAEKTVEFLIDKGCKLQYGEGKSAPIHWAAKSGKERIVKLLLDRGADISIRDGTQCTPVNKACMFGHVEVAKLLLERGADPKIPQTGSWTPLNIACYRKHFEVVKLLLEHEAVDEANIKTPSDDGWTPLYSATACYEFDIVKQLLDKGADPAKSEVKNWNPLTSACTEGQYELAKLLLDRGAHKIIDKGNDTVGAPIYLASITGHPRIVDLLLERGADYMFKRKDGWIPLMAASARNHIEIVRTLLNKMTTDEINSKTENGMTSLYIAASNNRPEVVEMLLRKGVDPDNVRNDDWTSLIIAASNDYVEVVKILLDKVSVEHTNRKTDREMTALYAASANNHPQVVKMLVEKGTEIASARKDGWTPLHAACFGDFQEVARLLLLRATDADINKTLPDGHTPLHGACGNSPTIAKWLLERNVDLTGTTRDGQTPLFKACNRGHYETAKLLLEKGAKPTISIKYVGGWTPLNITCSEGHPKIARLLLENGADQSITTDYGLTSLYVAASNGQLEIVQALLEYGALAHENDGSVQTAFNQAASYGHVNVLRFFVEEYGVDISEVDSFGINMLFSAARSGHTGTFEYFISKGLDWKCVDNGGDTLLHYAAMGGSLEIVNKVLRDYHVPWSGKTTWSPLHWACRTAKEDVVKLLKEEFPNSQVVKTEEPLQHWTPRAIGVFHRNKDATQSLAIKSHHPETYKEAEKHEDVYCNRCLKNIYGLRFKCSTCVNFDLCLMCKLMGHPDHEWTVTEWKGGKAVEVENVKDWEVAQTEA